MEEYNLLFNGYWRDCNRAGLPSYAGVYVVYRATYNADTDKVRLHEIIYIGKADDIRNRHVNHEKRSLFMGSLQEGEELCYSCAQVDGRSLDVVENALIFAQQPSLNTNGKESYNHHQAHLMLDGCCACMRYTDFNIR